MKHMPYMPTALVVEETSREETEAVLTECEVAEP